MFDAKTSINIDEPEEGRRSEEINSCVTFLETALITEYEPAAISTKPSVCRESQGSSFSSLLPLTGQL